MMFVDNGPCDYYDCTVNFTTCQQGFTQLEEKITIFYEEIGFRMLFGALFGL